MKEWLAVDRTCDKLYQLVHCCYVLKQKLITIEHSLSLHTVLRGNRQINLLHLLAISLWKEFHNSLNMKHVHEAGSSLLMQRPDHIIFRISNNQILKKLISFTSRIDKLNPCTDQLFCSLHYKQWCNIVSCCSPDFRSTHLKMTGW